MNITYAAPCLRPAWIRASRPRGTKALGLRYERAFAKARPEAVHGQWFHYLIDSAPHWCQTDFLFMGKKKIVVAELKLTDYDGARKQLDDLYVLVLRRAYPEHQIIPLIVLRNVGNVPDGVEICDSLKAAVQAPRAVLHWLGREPVG